MTRPITVKTGSIRQATEDAVVVFRNQGGEAPEFFAAIGRAVGPSFAEALAGAGFEGKAGQAVLVHTAGRIKPRVVVAAGLGPREGMGPERVRQAAARAAQRARDAGCERVAFDAAIGDDASSTVRACVEGALMGLYRFTRYKTAHDNNGRAVKTLVCYIGSGDAAAAQAGAQRGAIVAESVNHVRDLGNLPANVATPTYIADRARAVARANKLTCEVIDRRGMERLGMGALLGVAKGSMEPPKLIILRYEGGKRAAGAADRPVALVGKTITFDSGGISLKPADKMEQMKSDMMGGAGVLSVMEAAARLALPISIVGLLPATENMPSGTAIKPGDVVTAMSGTTVEVINTDAEGRLVLADALAYAVKRYQPRLIVDIATLTGACSVALGQHAIGLLGTDAALIARLQRAAEASGERVWQLPLWEEYYDQIKSDVADLKNTGGRPAGTITAAAFLSKFVGQTPWAHLDIAGTMWSDESRHYVTKGPTGAGVRLLIQFLMDEVGRSGARSIRGRAPARSRTTARRVARR
ncbi:MAG TPA: leucyl aminopeptidase [Nitrospiria bacterium]|nr:leucyl aminopeptidase [Nitrospiria bacterium]